jgi:hypothetical protein
MVVVAVGCKVRPFLRGTVEGGGCGGSSKAVQRFHAVGAFQSKVPGLGGLRIGIRVPFVTDNPTVSNALSSRWAAGDKDDARQAEGRRRQRVYNLAVNRYGGANLFSIRPLWKKSLDGGVPPPLSIAGSNDPTRRRGYPYPDRAKFCIRPR